jgi:hypothetical protein
MNPAFQVMAQNVGLGLVRISPDNIPAFLLHAGLAPIAEKVRTSCGAFCFFGSGIKAGLTPEAADASYHYMVGRVSTKGPVQLILFDSRIFTPEAPRFFIEDARRQLGLPTEPILERRISRDPNPADGN